MKVFISGTSFKPSYGGPAVSVARLASSLSSKGVEVGLWAPDGSTHQAAPVESSGVRILRGALRDAFAEFGDCDVIHDNGIWLWHNHQLRRLAERRALPRLVSLRGMLEPWAFAHKPTKKFVAWHVYQKSDLVRASCLHAATEVEATNIRRRLTGTSIRVISNGVDVPAAIPFTRDDSQKRKAIFLGRIYPVKGLPMLIEAWSRVRPAGWVLQIAGPSENNHRRDVERLVTRRNLEDVIALVGPINHDSKSAFLSAADLFVSPSHSESFGMAIAEALAHGVPVLTTTSTPWELLIREHCGWRVPPNVDTITEALREATSLSSQALRDMGARGRRAVQSAHSWDSVAAKFVTAYEAIVKQRVKNHPLLRSLQL